MWESSHWSNLFIGQILSCRSITWIITFTKSINFLVNFSSMMVTKLTGSSNSESNSGWMPSSNTSYSSITSMCFFLLMFDTESLDNTLNSVTSGNSKSINHFIFLEDLINSVLFFKHSISKVNFISNTSTINLNFHNMIFFLS